MHLSEGLLPLPHAAAWSVAAWVSVTRGLRSLRTLTARRPEARLLLGAAGGFLFVLTALKLPSVTGSSSHPTGTALGALLVGPGPMAVLGLVVLLFQALLLAHGGLTTLGANLVALAVVGPAVAIGTARGLGRLGVGQRPAIFAAAVASDLATYLTTALQLALAYPDPRGGIPPAFAAYAGIFAMTQVPLALAEGLLTVVVLERLGTAGLTPDLGLATPGTACGG